MKKFLIVIFLFFAFQMSVYSQCAVCKATVESNHDKPSKGLNNGIVYLAAMPFIFIGVIGYRWWKSQKDN
ncbi:MAG TPA: hypothetical protein PKA54_04925 [Chitinophagaceae bacterium]|nr:MAG: hypothetical protein UZ11_BCD004000318 [Bacteroidetes bacterium OLB11]HMN32695.1 hypothetical protein [Chitinophagaceae bacterium]